MAVIRTDGESTIETGTNFEAELAADGYHVERSPPHTQALNGKAERAGHVLIARARGLKTQARFPSVLWPEIVVAAAYLLNHSPTPSLGWLSPREFLQNALGRPQIPTLAHLFAYGSKTYWHKKNIPKLDRIEPVSGVGFLCGYQSSNVYRIWIPSEKTIKVFRDVDFDEDQFYSPDDPDILEQIRHANETTSILTSTFIESVDPEGVEGQDISTDESDDEFLISYNDVNVDIHEPVLENRDPPMDLPICPPDASETLATPRPTPEHESSSQRPEDDSDIIKVIPRTSQSVSQDMSEHFAQPEPDSTPLQPRKSRKADKGPAPRHTEISADMDPELVIPERTRASKRKETYALAIANVGNNAGFHDAFATGISQAYGRQHQLSLSSEPKYYKVMLAHPHSQQWQKVTNEEFEKLIKNGTAQIIDIPEDTPWRDILPMIWVWKYKTDEDGYLAGHKARLCARGDLEKLPSTKETFAATLAVRIFRVLMAIAVYFDLELRQLDAISAFTNSVLRRKIYVRLPDGFQQPRKCLLLHRALYGLKEAGHLWYEELTGTLRDLGLQCVGDEQCLWYNDWLVLFFYVDDVVAMFRLTHAPKWNRFRDDLCGKYDFKNLKDLK